MSNTVTENQKTSTTDVSKQQANSNDGYTERQLQSSFQPSSPSSSSSVILCSIHAVVIFFVFLYVIFLISECGTSG